MKILIFSIGAICLLSLSTLLVLHKSDLTESTKITVKDFNECWNHYWNEYLKMDANPEDIAAFTIYNIKKD